MRGLHFCLSVLGLSSSHLSKVLEIETMKARPYYLLGLALSMLPCRHAVGRRCGNRDLPD